MDPSTGSCPPWCPACGLSDGIETFYSPWQFLYEVKASYDLTMLEKDAIELASSCWSGHVFPSRLA